jgi:hypothetical protein
VSSPEELAEGAVYIVRKHRADIKALCLYAGILLALFLICAGLAHLLLLGQPTPVSHVVTHPLHAKPSFPPFKP